MSSDRVPERAKDAPSPTKLAQTITAQDMKRHLSTIASTEFEGRETGTDGQKKAAEYIARYFQKLGIPAIGNDGNYFQQINFFAENWENIDLEMDGTPLRHLWDYYAMPADNESRDWKDIDEVTFLGYGIDDPAYSDYKGTDVAGKAILIYPDEPKDRKGNYLVSGTSNPSDWFENLEKKLQVAKQHGVEVVFIIDNDFKQNVSNARREILNRRLAMVESLPEDRNLANSVFLSSEVAKKMISGEFKKVVKARKRIQKKGKLRSVSIPVNLRLRQEKSVRSLVGENVLGYIEGTDPELKDELLVITAHYDHLGKRGEDIYFGADDNGSGTSTVLEVAQAFAQAKSEGWGPRRSVLIMLVSGEEKGLLGSQYYVEYPIFPLENTIANVNVDMVGRVDPKHEEKGNSDYIYVIGSNRLSTELHQINEDANARYTQLELDYTYNAEDDPNRYYYRSDHYNFAERGIPAIFYFNGTHEDYHRTSDTVDKINFEKMEKIGRLVFYTSWELANRDDRIKVDVRP
ncbi:peptidase M28 [Flavilitoribacter nigricans DSM 23189 = NBRC 102662]|uniref:Peptidase M28 n=2 Tax=Flavilitoribacter TaxID=2762562 RepID=A0A2D0NAU1_FLAN2|nr:peptidase M28 [Flavilitoribacter nigricans DSM 23189 = NBRC 102662]